MKYQMLRVIGMILIKNVFSECKQLFLLIKLCLVYGLLARLLQLSNHFSYSTNSWCTYHNNINITCSTGLFVHLRMDYTYIYVLYTYV